MGGRGGGISLVFKFVKDSQDWWKYSTLEKVLHFDVVAWGVAEVAVAVAVTEWEWEWAGGGGGCIASDDEEHGGNGNGEWVDNWDVWDGDLDERQAEGIIFEDLLRESWERSDLITSHPEVREGLEEISLHSRAEEKLAKLEEWVTEELVEECSSVLEEIGFCTDLIWTQGLKAPFSSKKLNPSFPVGELSEEECFEESLKVNSWEREELAEFRQCFKRWPIETETRPRNLEIMGLDLANLSLTSNSIKSEGYPINWNLPCQEGSTVDSAIWVRQTWPWWGRRSKPSPFPGCIDIFKNGSGLKNIPFVKLRALISVRYTNKSRMKRRRKEKKSV